jgi:hypothetical protein
MFSLTAAGRTSASTTNVAAPPRRSVLPWLLGIGIVLLATAGGWIYFNVYVPEQNRLAAQQERAHQAELALQTERARQAEAQQKAAEERAAEEHKKEEAERAQMAKDQEAYSAIMAKIAAVTDASPLMQINETQRTVHTYVRTAPEAYRDRVEKAWNVRQGAWRALMAAHRPGSVRLETEPAGATVILYPQNERRTSPALFEDVKPGDVTLRIELDGYESRDVAAVVKPGSVTKVEPVQLAPTFGGLTITSDPPDVYVLLESGARRTEGHTPFNPARLPPGEYHVTYQRPAWHPVIKTVTVERGKTARVFAELKGFNVELRSSPPGAQITVDRQPTGTTPLKFSGLEPREYQVTATLDGYEVLRRNLNVTRNENVTLTLVEKPLPHALRRIAGQRWHYESFATSAEFTFTAQGKITGKHHSGLGGQARDIGVAESFTPSTNTFTARFTANQGKPFYAGAVQIKIIDEDHLAVSWREGDSTERLVFERDKAGK